jgi:hypothetical protein
MKKYLIAMAAALALAVHADTKIEAIGVHIGSHHVPARDFQNANPGAYARWTNGMTLGAYYNSERHMSMYAGYTYQHGPFAVTAGLITGYERRPVMPMIVPSVRLVEQGSVSLRLAVLPKLEKRGATVFHVMLEVKQ